MELNFTKRKKNNCSQFVVNLLNKNRKTINNANYSITFILIKKNYV